ncbi:MAG: oxidoreductase [Gammaproteobacteria bacterium BRH_c0]|nr:MAG: oxidoreductase [Gammaproteobacteria bacterium BRH_c0]
MPRLIKGNVIVDNEWQLIPADLSGDLPQGKLLVPLAKWLELKDAPVEGQTLAPWIDSEEEVEPVAAELLSAPLIAVHFPTFMDGRGFSTARLLRERFGYQGELRAVGYVIQDQLFFLKRCGFDAFDLREGTDLEAALASLNDFTVTYQAATDNPEPLFRKR